MRSTTCICWQSPVAVTLATALLIFLYWYRGLIPPTYTIKPTESKGCGCDNEKLGFGDIIAMVPEKRSEIQDPLDRAANATEIKLTFQEVAVPDEESASDKAGYGRMDSGQTVPGQQAQTLAHLQALKNAASRKLSSALILEPTADWDMRIHSSISQLLSAVQNVTFEARITETYHGISNHRYHARDLPTASTVDGSHWDILWLGHCGAAPGFTTKHYIYNDSASTGADHMSSVQHEPKIERKRGQQLLFSPEKAACTTAYAVSANGAEKLVHALATTSVSLDETILSLCDSHLHCLSPYPPLFSAVEDTDSAGPGTLYSARVNGHSNISISDSPNEWMAEWMELEAVPGFSEEKGEMDSYASHSWGNCAKGSKDCWEPEGGWKEFVETMEALNRDFGHDRGGGEAWRRKEEGAEENKEEQKQEA